MSGLTRPAVTPDPAAKDSDVPWIVFMEQTAMRNAPRQNAAAQRTLSRGTEIVGYYYTDPQTDEEWIVVQEEGEFLYVLRAHLTRIHPVNRTTGNLPIGFEIANRWWGMPISYEPSDLVAIPREWGQGTRTYHLRQEARDALVELLEAARADGVEIRVISAYRSGPVQQRLYIDAINKDGARQRYSAPPGHSEHQLGTTVDLSDHEGRHDFSRVLDQLPVGMWLEKNAVRFGFIRTYYPWNIEETGYISEPWHWRYFGRERALEVKAEMDEKARRAAGN